ncbi:MAG: hypothetical protein K6T83_10325 [Alicyclobacillus sp.]|nr:hypothetical protein [Alicyclobacillus sp.]
MKSAQERVSEVLSVVTNLGLHDVSPIILNDAANLSVHLAPYPIVARVAKQLPGHSARSWREVLARGWKWSDFEDVSLMPRFWDLASLIGNIALFNGLRHPIINYALYHPMVVNDRSSFQFAITARVIMATTTNLALALSGNGDVDFAQRQLACIGDFLGEVETNLK